MFEIKVSPFESLTKQELYDILQLRSGVFVVEQDSVYQDIDGKDQKAIHVLGVKEGRMIAYARIFKPGDYFKQASIGRVVVAQGYRHLQYGKRIMKASMIAVQTFYNETTIKISAQCYLLSFYTNLGFQAIGESYLEDGIPHIAMMRS